MGVENQTRGEPRGDFERLRNRRETVEPRLKAGSPVRGALAAWRARGFVIFAVTISACKGHTPSDDLAAAARPASSAADAATIPAAAPASDATILPGQNEADFVVKDFHFTSGETLGEVRIHYATIGTRHRNAHGSVDNAILLLHGTTGRAKAFFADPFRREMFGPNQPFDASKFFVVLPDNIGHGASSKPSDALHGRFPHYGYADMVQLQHRLVVEGLGLTHLHIVAGTSMGGMHAWMWTEAYPGFMDAAIPIAATPMALSGRNLLWRRLVIEATRSDPAYNGGEYSHPPHGFVATLPLFYMMIDSTQHLARVAPDLKSATELLVGWAGTGHPILDANDAIYALDASRDYDPEPQIDKISAPVLAINFADDEIVGPSIHEAQSVIMRVPRARQIVVPATDATRGHATLGLAAQWERPVVEFLAGLQ